MDHVAIMKKSWGLTQKILSGQKKIESRWYKSKHSPWGKIEKGDIVYFKDSGEPISIKTGVEKVMTNLKSESPEIDFVIKRPSR